MGTDRAHIGGAGAKDARSRNGASRGKTNHRVAVAHFQDSSSKIPLHLRPILPAESYQPGVVRILSQGEDCRWKLDSQMEKVRLRKPVLPAVYSNQGHQLRDELHLPGTEVEVGGRSGGRVRTLRLPGLLRINAG